MCFHGLRLVGSDRLKAGVLKAIHSKEVSLTRLRASEGRSCHEPMLPIVGVLVKQRTHHQLELICTVGLRIDEQDSRGGGGRLLRKRPMIRGFLRSLVSIGGVSRCIAAQYAERIFSSTLCLRVGLQPLQ